MASNRRLGAAFQLSCLRLSRPRLRTAAFSSCSIEHPTGTLSMSRPRPLYDLSFPSFQSTRPLSSSSSSPSNNSKDKTNTTVVSLKNMIKPFFLKCHPDVVPTAAAKRVNLQALQTMNGLLDVLQATCQGRVVEWPSKHSLEVEFVIIVQERIKKDIVETMSRRKVELVLPPESLRSAVVSTRNARNVARLEHYIKQEFAKLLKVAGLPVPVVLSPENDSIDGVWNDELDFMDDSNTGRTFATTRYEKSRQQFVQNVDWKRIHRLTHEAVADMEADLATEGSITQHAQRRQALITDILSKIRIEDGVEIDPIEQLICFRRLSLILEDNFEELYMEDMGRMWENLVIVLKGPRDYNTSRSAMRKRTKRAQDTGYSFSYASNGTVTIHIPIDFGDEELVAELDRNLWDFYNLVGDGVEDLYPKWFTEQ